MILHGTYIVSLKSHSPVHIHTHTVLLYTALSLPHVIHKESVSCSGTLACRMEQPPTFWFVAQDSLKIHLLWTQLVLLRGVAGAGANPSWHWVRDRSPTYTDKQPFTITFMVNWESPINLTPMCMSLGLCGFLEKNTFMQTPHWKTSAELGFEQLTFML